MSPVILTPIFTLVGVAIGTAGSILGELVKNNKARQLELEKAERARQLELEKAEGLRKLELEKAEKIRLLELEKAEKAQKLDLYRFVYPAKLTAGKEVMSKARPLIEDVMLVYHSGPAIKSQRPELFSEITASLQELNLAVTANAWLLGDQVEDAGKHLVSLLSMVLKSPDMRTLYDRDHEDKIIATYRTLSTAVREQMHLPQLNALLDPS